MPRKQISTTSERIDESESRPEAESEDVAPLISESEWEITIGQPIASNPQAAAARGDFLVRLQEDAESGPEGRARAVETLKEVIGKIEGLSSKYVC